jgi:Ni/Fe-hydrogenase 1 B-type cytochrome subunit
MAKVCPPRKASHVATKHWSNAMCINHWAMAISIVLLIVTGFYIAKPFTVGAGETTQKFLMANIRFIHLIFGLLLVALLIWRTYLAFFSRFHADWKDLYAWANVKNTWQAVKFYTLISTEPPEHCGLYGSLQSAAYLFLFVITFVEALTGMILYGALHQAGLAKFSAAVLGPIQRGIFGGLAGARFVHSAFIWLFIIFALIHTYLAFWYDVVFSQGTISSIVNGNFFEEAEEQKFREG